MYRLFCVQKLIEQDLQHPGAPRHPRTVANRTFQKTYLTPSVPAMYRFRFRAAIKPRHHTELFVKIARSSDSKPIAVEDKVGKDKVYTRVDELRGMVDVITDIMIHSEVHMRECLMDKKDKLECLVFGYIKDQMERNTVNQMPYSLKCLCLLWYGNICMDSAILNVDNINRIGMALRKSASINAQYFCGQKLYYSRFQTFVKQQFSGTYRYRPGTMIVVKTTDKDIFVVFQASNRREICAVIQTPLDTSPLVQVAPVDSDEVCCAYSPVGDTTPLKEDEELVLVAEGRLGRKYTLRYDIESLELFQF